MIRPKLNDPELVRREYADESGLAARMAVQQSATGPDPYAVVFEAVAEREPGLVLEVGCGRGELAERMSRELNASVVAVDQSERMVELTAARGVEAIVADAQDLPFRRRDLRLRCRGVDALPRAGPRADAPRAAPRPSSRTAGWSPPRAASATSASSGSSSASAAPRRAGSPPRMPKALSCATSRSSSVATYAEPSRSPTARPPTATSRRARPAVSSPTACRSSTARSSRPGTSPSSCASRDQARGAHRAQARRRGALGGRDLASSSSATRAGRSPTTRCRRS